MNTMIQFKIDITNENSVEASFSNIAKQLFKDVKLQVNDGFYRLVDIEFYYFAAEHHADVYAHQHLAQLQTGKWYFHGSGLDITIGNGQDHGGILIRAIAKISEAGDPKKFYIEKEIHGPINVKTEICSNLRGVFEEGVNIFRLVDADFEAEKAPMAPIDYIINTKRIGLNSAKVGGENLSDKKYRYVVFPSLKLRDKTRIASDMQAKFGLSDADINKAMGSKFF